MRRRAAAAAAVPTRYNSSREHSNQVAITSIPLALSNDCELHASCSTVPRRYPDSTQSKSNFQSPDGEHWVTDRRKIAWHYVASFWFMVDVLSIGVSLFDI